MKKIQIQEAPLDLAEALAFLHTPAAGAIDVFVGTTRQWTDGRETRYLAYEAYQPMALAEMERLVEEARAQWTVERVCLIHRLGVVPLSEASVVVGVATAHRADAFAACRFLIDALKQRVPIWKREVYVDGSSAWVEGSLPPG